MLLLLVRRWSHWIQRVLLILFVWHYWWCPKTGLFRTIIVAGVLANDVVYVLLHLLHLLLFFLRCRFVDIVNIEHHHLISQCGNVCRSYCGWTWCHCLLLLSTYFKHLQLPEQQVHIVVVVTRRRIAAYVGRSRGAHALRTAPLLHRHLLERCVVMFLSRLQIIWLHLVVVLMMVHIFLKLYLNCGAFFCSEIFNNDRQCSSFKFSLDIKR